MYFIVPHGKPLDINLHERHANAAKAIKVADDWKVEFGGQYNVIKVDTVWTTQTLGELRAEGVL
jgi:hypothetical protein